MVKRIIDLISWVAMALVVVAIALRFQTLKPEWVDYATPISISALILGVTEGQQHGFGSVFSTAALAAFVILAVAFVVIERHTIQPMLPGALLRDPVRQALAPQFPSISHQALLSRRSRSAATPARAG